MISMIEHIEYLMLSNDCVVVPGFGAFIAQYTSSHNCAQNSTFTSPKRSISFNASINHNDGLLANSIAKKASIPYAEALKQIEKSTTICRQALSDGSEVPFGRLGFFISNADSLNKMKNLIITNLLTMTSSDFNHSRSPLWQNEMHRWLPKKP